MRRSRWVPGGRGVRESWPRSPGGSFASCSFGASPRNKPSRDAISCVRDQLAFEQQLVQQLDATRDRLRTCLVQARGPRGADQVAWTSIARAVLGRPASVAEIRRLAGTLANRHWRR